MVSTGRVVTRVNNDLGYLLIYHIEREEEMENDEAVDDEDELYEYHGT